jgi:diguanylate cyclase (GGDEF)-like protein
MTQPDPMAVKDEAAETAEDQRLQALYDLAILDTDEETEFNELAQLAAAICGTPMSAISLIDRSRQWFKARIGIAMTETSRETSFCDHAIRHTDLLVVEDASADSRFNALPLVTDDPGVRFYAGMPLRNAAGFALGSLCVVDTQPRTLTEQQRNALRVLGRQVMSLLELRAQQRATEEAIAEKDRIAAGLAEYQAQLEAANDQLRALAVTDELTGLRNRRAFEERLGFEFALSRRKRRDLSVLLLDVDNFKQINDTLGHPAGDDVLRQLSRVLRESVRATDLAVRFGGEEFAVILSETDETSAMLWCHRFQRRLAASDGPNGLVTVSIGAAGLGPHVADTSHLVALADEALYRAKHRGKNCSVASHDLARLSTRS